MNAFYLLDFAINAGILLPRPFPSFLSHHQVQACIRALIVDVLPTEKQEIGNAWAGRMIGVGSVLGYLTYVTPTCCTSNTFALPIRPHPNHHVISGFLDLVSMLPFLGNTQFKVISAIAGIFLVLSVFVTCWSTTEASSLQDISVKKYVSSYSTLPYLASTLTLPSEPQCGSLYVKSSSPSGHCPFPYSKYATCNS